MKKLVYTISVFVCSIGFAQDFHLSQFENAQLRMNPALTGRDYRDGKEYRVTTTYRTQWSTVSTKPFTSYYLGYDTKFKDKWGMGAHLMSNQAGAPTFRTFNFIVSGSYDIMNDPNKEHELVAGIHMGLMNKNYKTDDLLFDSQYSSATGEFDPSVSSGENIATRSIYRFDAGMGLYYRYRPQGTKYSPYVGFSLGHISVPNQSFTDKEPLPLLWRYMFGGDIEVTDYIDIDPDFLIMFQNKAWEFMVNINGTYKLKNEDYDLRLLLGYRMMDAMVFGFGMRYKDFVAKASYDVNTSYLNNYTSGRGGFEISIAYQGLYNSPKLQNFFRQSKAGD